MRFSGYPSHEPIGKILVQKKDPKTRDDAWVGDAVLSLFAREWILKQDLDGEFSKTQLYHELTCNQFLNSFGNPTEVEARIAGVYQKEGLGKAFEYIEETFIPVFQRTIKKKRRQRN